MQNMEKFYGPNAGYVLELYERYQQDPASSGYRHTSDI